MQTHTDPYLRAHRRATDRTGIAPWKKILAAAVSATLCLGMVPVAPAWGDGTTADPAPATAPENIEPAAGEPAADSAPDSAPSTTDAATTDDAANADGPLTAETDSPAPPAANDDFGDEDTAAAAAVPATDTSSTATEAPGQSDEDPTATESPDDATPPAETVEQHFPTDKKAAAKLLKKLIARFSADGDDGKLSAATVDAAIALNALGKGADIDADALIKNFLRDEKSDEGLTLGRYGRYIMALTAAGIDCTKAEIDGKTRNLVVEMEKLSEKTDPSLDEVVYMLPVYGNDEYRNISGLTPDGLIDLLLAAQDEVGFFWPSEKAETYSIPLTSQALLALLPYAEDDDDVAAAVVSASEALYDAQLIDGSWPADGLKLEGDVPATAYATAALVALGADPAKDLKTSNDSTPLGYLTAHADKSLDGYTDLDGLEKNDEPAAAATVLMALAANEGYNDSKEAFDVYDVREVKRPTTTATTTKPKTTTPSSTYRSSTAAKAGKTIPQSGDELPWSMGFAGAAAAFALAAALIARRRIREL